MTASSYLTVYTKIPFSSFLREIQVIHKLSYDDEALIIKVVTAAKCLSEPSFNDECIFEL